MQKTHQPQEIEVWYILPAIRKEIAKELKNKNYSHTDISKTLGLTKAAISQYLNKKRGKEVVFPEEIKKRIKQAAKIVGKEPNKSISEIQKIIQEIRNTGLLCKYHKDYCIVDDACVVCIE
ncbi:hypothetical protein GOV08_04880 [Candidatus Woesearchaeota archaeon]|nr:hypothetical protein [Candidatus Woesearchaeota archaeon]